MPPDRSGLLRQALLRDLPWFARARRPVKLPLLPAVQFTLRAAQEFVGFAMLPGVSRCRYFRSGIRPVKLPA